MMASNDVRAETETARNDSADVLVTRDSREHEGTRLVNGKVEHDVDSERTTRVNGHWLEEDDAHVMELIHNATAEREQRENLRANKRNFNRMLTLIGALVISTIVTYVLTNKGIPAAGWTLPVWAFGLAPYSFTITLALDMGLAVYGLIKHY